MVPEYVTDHGALFKVQTFLCLSRYNSNASSIQSNTATFDYKQSDIIINPMITENYTCETILCVLMEIVMYLIERLLLIAKGKKVQK